MSFKINRRDLLLSSFSLPPAFILIAKSQALAGEEDKSMRPTQDELLAAGVTGLIARNHGHLAGISGEALRESETTTISIQGGSAHSHSLNISESEIAELIAGEEVLIKSSTSFGHSHDVTLRLVKLPLDVSGLVDRNHGHFSVIKGIEMIEGDSDIVLDIQGESSHPHTITLSQDHLDAIFNGEAVTVISSRDQDHSHAVTFNP